MGSWAGASSLPEAGTLLRFLLQQQDIEKVKRHFSRYGPLLGRGFLFLMKHQPGVCSSRARRPA